VRNKETTSDNGEFGGTETGRESSVMQIVWQISAVLVGSSSCEGAVAIGLLFGAKSRLADTVGSDVVRLNKSPLYFNGVKKHSTTADSRCRPEEGAVEVLRKPIGWCRSQ
jgi:hypothetical protein